MFGLKRQIEEKTEDYMVRVREVQERYAAEHAEREQRERAVLAEAEIASRARYTKLRTAYARQMKAWSFSASVNGTFLTLRWTDTKGSHAHALNTQMVADIVLDLSGAQPPRKTGAFVRYNESRWEFVDDPEYRYRVGFDRSSYWTHETEAVFPSAARYVRLVFRGLDFTVSVPFGHAEAAYAAVMEAVS